MFSPSEKKFLIKKYDKYSDKTQIYKLWYQVYFLEMNRDSKYANHQQKTVIDVLEPDSTILTVELAGKVIGSSRIHKNYLNKNHYYYDLYSLDKFINSEFCIVSKYMIAKKYRNLRLTYLLALATVEYCRNNNIKWILVDCSPAAYDYFEKLRFIQYKEVLQSPEYGEVKVMKFDVLSSAPSLLNMPHIINKYKNQIDFL